MNVVLDNVERTRNISATADDEGNHIVCGRYENPWFCAVTEPKSELHAFSALSEIRFKSYFPQIRVRRHRYGKPETYIKPLFPGYLFVSFDPSNDPWGLIFRTRGISRIMMNAAGQPVPLRDGEIPRLMAMGRAGDGIIDDQAPAFPLLAPGEKLRIVDGPLSDWSGVCAWSNDQRVGVLMTMFSAERVVPMARSLVTSAA